MFPSRVRQADDIDSAPDGLFARAMLAFRQFMCALHGHDALLHFEQSRLSLRCTSCGYEPRGWNLAKEEQEASAPAVARVRLLPQRLLAGARKA